MHTPSAWFEALPRTAIRGSYLFVHAGVRPGGLIMIHGLDPAIAAKWRSDHWMFNWTRGCIAVTNDEMDVIWDSVALGTPIEILP